MLALLLAWRPPSTKPPSPTVHRATISMMSRRHRRAHLQPLGAPAPAPARPATLLEPAVLAGVAEDHNFEQFFFDAPTRASLLALLAQYERPLLLCTPSLSSIAI